MRFVATLITLAVIGRGVDAQSGNDAAHRYSSAQMASIKAFADLSRSNVSRTGTFYISIRSEYLPLHCALCND